MSSFYHSRAASKKCPRDSLQYPSQCPVGGSQNSTFLMPLNVYYSSLILPSLLLCFPLLASLSILLTVNRGFPGGASGENPAVQCRRLRDKFDPWVRKIPWRREGQPSPVSLPGESHGQRSLAGFKRSIGLQRSQRHD